MTAIPETIRSALSGSPSLFLSPHLDDAVLSCGLLLTEAAKASTVTVATVFTEATPGPYTRAARSFLRQCGAEPAANAENLYVQRRAEDVTTVIAAGAHPVHLAWPDALFRTRGRGPFTPVLASVAPELVHRYPTFRFDIARGRVSLAEKGLAPQIADRVRALIDDTGAQVIFCPLGVGRHVDHLLVRSVGQYLDRPVIYYSDFPYSLKAQPDKAFLASLGLRKWTWHGDTASKYRLIQGYKTQFAALFPDGAVSLGGEDYFIAD